jgi:DNA-binding transcriptional ArsR family regulator
MERTNYHVVSYCVQQQHDHTKPMIEDRLRRVLLHTRGTGTRLQILREIDTYPRNMHRLAIDLELDYTTVRYHMEILENNDIVRSGGTGHGVVYLPSRTVRQHYWGTVTDIIEANE